MVGRTRKVIASWRSSHVARDHPSLVEAPTVAGGRTVAVGAVGAHPTRRTKTSTPHDRLADCARCPVLFTFRRPIIIGHVWMPCTGCAGRAPLVGPPSTPGLSPGLRASANTGTPYRRRGGARRVTSSGGEGHLTQVRCHGDRGSVAHDDRVASPVQGEPSRPPCRCTANRRGCTERHRPLAARLDCAWIAACPHMQVCVEVDPHERALSPRSPGSLA